MVLNSVLGYDESYEITPVLEENLPDVYMDYDLVMYKSLENKDHFELTGVSDEVREILETTGFDQFLLKE